MFKAIAYPLFIYLFFAGPIAVAQNENSKWYFGLNSGLDFMTAPPTVLTGALSTLEGCASVADATGNILFYTDGITVYNQGNVPMANGTGLMGHTSTTQSALIVKKPGSSNLYYVFTLGAGGSGILDYSIVDMSLAAGIGSVTVKNVPLAVSMSEKLVAARHCNGTDFWILAHDSIDHFYSYQLSSLGVSAPVLTACGYSFVTTDYAGDLKVSPNGKKLGMAVHGSNSSFGIYDFDNSTGVVSNPFTLLFGFAATTAYGCEFSPDGTKLYGTRETGNPILYQWDLCAGSPTAIIASQYTTAVSTGISGMQVAIDGKIYVAAINQPFIGVINNPNVAGSGCNYVFNGQSIAPHFSQLNLPNCLLDFRQSPVPFTHTVSMLYGCQTASFHSVYAASHAAPTCSFMADFTPDIAWDFGDPASGAANTSTLSSPIHAYSALGTYTASLILHYGCGYADDTLKQVVLINQPCVTINSTSITCANLGSATVTPQAGFGPYSYTWMPTAQTGSVATGLMPGTYSLALYDVASNSVYIIPTALSPSASQLLAGSIAHSTMLACYGASTGTAAVSSLLNGSGNQTYLWSNGTYTSSNAAPTGLNSGIWSVTVTDALTGCQFNQQFFISQPLAVNVIPAANTLSVCLGGNSIVLTGTASGGTPAYLGPDYTFSWTAGPAGTTQTVSQNLAGNYTYTLNATDSLGCSGSQTIVISFVPHPTLTAGNASICPLQTGTLTVIGASSYTWNNGAAGSTFTGSPVSSQQYTVTGETLGCSSSTVAEIILVSAPVPVFGSNSPVCQGDALIFTVSGGTLYSWSGPNGFISSSADNTIHPVTINANGVYNVTVTAANSCTAAASETMMVNPQPVLTVSPGSSSICANTTSIVLTAAGTATLFDWQPNQSVSSGTTSTISAYPPSTQIYTLTGSLNNCASIVTVTVTVVPPPLPIISLSSGSTCAEIFNGSPNTITLTSSGANTYTISTPSDIYNSNPTGPVTGLNTLPPHVPGVATATLYGSNGVCTLSTTMLFTIVPNPTVSVSNPTPVICAGQTYTYTNAGADSYTWSSSTPGQTLYTTGSVAVADPTTNAIFSVYGGSIGCNSPLQSTTITVNPLPLLYVQPEPAVMCLNNSITLTAEGTTGSSYNWQPSYWLTANQGSMVMANPPSQQSYTVIASLNSCTASAVVTVSVLPLPVVSVGTSSTTILCLNQPFILQARGAEHYIWQYPNSLTAPGASLQIVPANVSYSGIYTLTGTSYNGCSNTATVNMHVEDSPNGYLKSGQQISCAPFFGSYQFIATNHVQQDVSVTAWQVNSIQVTPANQLSYYFAVPGNYLITGSLVSTSGCAGTIAHTVMVYPKPQADFTFVPEKPVENFDRVSFTPVNAATNSSFNWSFVNTNANNQSEGPNPDYLFETAGSYPVALVVKNQWGCQDSIVKIITVEQDFAVYVPNAFTPNVDGRNELFYAVTRGVQTFSFVIFNRWGEKLFTTNNPAAGWDGTFQGQPCKEDVYVWKLEVIGTDGEEKKLNGFVTLLH